jgi:hypothetical protein
MFAQALERFKYIYNIIFATLHTYRSPKQHKRTEKAKGKTYQRRKDHGGHGRKARRMKDRSETGKKQE